MYEIILSKRAAKDRKLLKQAGLEAQARELLAVIKEDPYRDPPPAEMLRGNLKGLFSRRISYQHRLVYEVLKEEQIVHVLRMWTHYE